MWIAEAPAERVAGLLHNYQNALNVFGKGSESGSRQESAQPEKSPMTPAAKLELESTMSHEYFAQPGDAEWGCLVQAFISAIFEDLRNCADQVPRKTRL